MEDSQYAELLKEIRLVRQILEIQARPQLVKVIETVASTPERKELWRLSKGDMDYKQMAKQIGVTVQSVYNFINDGQEKGVMEMEKRGFPKRRIDYIPLGWKKFKPRKKKAEEPTEVMPDAGSNE